MAGIAALAIGYVLSQFYRSFLAVLTPVLTIELGMTKVQLSVASGAWFITFALTQFAIGVSLDRFGPRRTAAPPARVWRGFGAFLFAIATAPWMVIAAMALIGIGCAPVLMASLFIYRAQLFAGALRGARLLDDRVRHRRQRHRRFAAGQCGRGFRLAAGHRRARRLHAADRAAALSYSCAIPPSPKAWRGSAGFAGYGELFRMQVLWPIMPLTALNYAPATGIRGLWAGPYLADVYGADSLVIGQVTLFMALAMVAGAFLYGRSTRSSRRANGSQSAAIR